MAAHTIPIDFRVETGVITDEANRKQLLQKLIPLIEHYSGPLTEVASIPLPCQQHQYVYSVPTGSTLNVKVYANGLVSAVLEFYTDEVNKQLIGVDEAMKFEARIVKACGASMAKVLPAIKRAPPINPYYTSSDDRLFEYDFDRVVFHEKTAHQTVDILHSKSFGNMLVLDNLQNLAESDLDYTRGLMNYGIEDYSGKTCLILGGGDGALMHELLKENPQHVLMVELDEVVMHACKKHLRSACGSTLDSYSGENYETIVGDALVHLKDYIKSGRQFDYVFSDLTDVPISKEPVGELWDFLGLVMELASKVLKPGTGRYMTHAVGVQCEGALAMFEERIRRVEVGVSSVTRTAHFVPSFMEKWCFFQATRSPLQQ